MMVDGKDVIYKVSSWRFDDLWAKGESLFSLGGLDANKDKVKSITYTRGQDKLEFVRRGEKDWMMKPAAPGMTLKTDKINDIAGAVAGLKPDDYVDAAAVASCGLDAPLAVVSFTTEDKKTHTVSIGGEAKTLEGRYVSLDGGKTAGVLAKYDAGRAAPQPKDLFELKVAEIKAEDVLGVDVSGSSTLAIVRESGKPWSLSASDASIPVSESAINSYLGRFSPLNADDITLGRHDGFVATDTVCIKMTNGRALTLQFAAVSGGKRIARIDGVGIDVVFESSSAGRLIPTVKDLADRKLVTLKQDEIVKVSIARTEDPFELVKDADAWTLTVAGEARPCNGAAADAYVRRLVGAKASGVEVGKGVSGEGLGTIVVTGKDGVELKLALGAEADGTFPVQRGADAIIYAVTKNTADYCLPASSTLVAAAAPEQKVDE
jgi:hypothetical protein